MEACCIATIFFFLHHAWLITRERALYTGFMWSWRTWKIHMGFEWLISRPGEVICWKSLKMSKVMENENEKMHSDPTYVIFWCTRNRPFACTRFDTKRSWNFLILFLPWKTHWIFKFQKERKHCVINCFPYFTSYIYSKVHCNTPRHTTPTPIPACGLVSKMVLLQACIWVWDIRNFVCVL